MTTMNRSTSPPSYRADSHSTMHLWLRCIVLGLLLFTAVPASAGPGYMTIERIMVDGTSRQSGNFDLILPKSKTKTPKQLRVGANLTIGTEIRVPAGTSITLLSSNGNKLESKPGGMTLKVIGVSPKGEVFEVFFGSVQAFVNKKLDFFNIGHGGKTAAAKSTNYTVSIGANNQLLVQVDEGIVDVQQPARVEVGGKKYTGYLTHDQLQAGQSLSQAQTSEYQSFAIAAASFRQQRDLALESGDEWTAANWQYNLANLAYDTAQTPAAAREAAAHYRYGIENIALLETDLYFAALYLDGYAGAMFDAEEYKEAMAGHIIALAALQEWDPELESFLASAIAVSLGNDLLKTKENDAAIEAFEAAGDALLNGFDDNAQDEEILENILLVSFGLGVAYHRLERWEDAAEAFNVVQSLMLELQAALDMLEDEDVEEIDEIIAEIDRRLEAIYAGQSSPDDDDEYLTTFDSL